MIEHPVPAFQVDVLRPYPRKLLVQEPLVDDELPQVKPEAVTPDLETLRKKYEAEGYSAPEDSEAGSIPNVADHSPVSSDEAEDIIVIVQPKGADATWIPGPAPKAVVISSEEKRIVSIQG